MRLPARILLLSWFYRSTRVRSIFLSRDDDWATAGVAAAALRQVPQASISGSFSSDEHPPGTRTPSPPFLLYETEHPNPSL